MTRTPTSAGSGVKKLPVDPNRPGRVLLPLTTWMFTATLRKRSGEPVCSFVDPTSLEFVVLAMQPAGACEIVLDATRFRNRRAVRQLLDPSLQRSVRFYRSARTNQAIRDICEPLEEELGLSLGDGFARVPNGTDRELADAAIAVSWRVQTLIDGMLNRCIIDVDLGSLRESIHRLQSRCRSSANVGNMARLAKIVDAYTTKVPGVQVVASGHKELMRHIKDMVDDVEYRRLSNDYFRLGIPSLMRQALLRIRPALRRLFAEPRSRGVLRETSSSIAIPGSPVRPNTEVVANMLESDYVPPIADMSTHMRRAHARWAARNPTGGIDGVLDAFERVVGRPFIMSRDEARSLVLDKALPRAVRTKKRRYDRRSTANR